MEETHAQERWQLENNVDRLQTRLDEALLVLHRLDEYLTMSHVGHPETLTAFLELRRAYSTWQRLNYPNPRP